MAMYKEQKRHPLVRGLRVVFVCVAWLYVFSLVTQIYLAGLGIFGLGAGLLAHMSVGWLLALLGIILIPTLAALARLPRTIVLLALLMIPLSIIQVMLVTVLRALHAPPLTALHPVNAVLMVLVAVLIASKSQRVLKG